MEMEHPGDLVLQLPRYSLPFSLFQCYIGNVDPSHFFIALTGTIVGLSYDPSFQPASYTNRKTRNQSHHSPFPTVSNRPRLLNWIPICENVGIGIIHSIDIRKNLITILTPLETEQMKKVNTVIRSTEPIPNVLLRNVVFKIGVSFVVITYPLPVLFIKHCWYWKYPC